MAIIYLFYLFFNFFFPEVTLFNIVFIYVLNILIPLGSPSDLFEVSSFSPL